jgi:hypothetical protein
VGPSAARVQGQLVDCKGCGKDSHGKSKGARGFARIHQCQRVCCRRQTASSALAAQIRLRIQACAATARNRAGTLCPSGSTRMRFAWRPAQPLPSAVSRSPIARPTAHPIQPSTASHTQTDRPLCNVPRTVARTPTRERSSCASDAVRREYPRPTSLEWCGYLLNPASARRQRVPSRWVVAQGTLSSLASWSSANANEPASSFHMKLPPARASVASWRAARGRAGRHRWLSRRTRKLGTSHEKRQCMPHSRVVPEHGAGGRGGGSGEAQ